MFRGPPHPNLRISRIRLFEHRVRYVPLSPNEQGSIAVRCAELWPTSSRVAPCSPPKSSRAKHHLPSQSCDHPCSRCASPDASRVRLHLHPRVHLRLPLRTKTAQKGASPPAAPNVSSRCRSFRLRRPVMNGQTGTFTGPEGNSGTDRSLPRDDCSASTSARTLVPHANRSRAAGAFDVKRRAALRQDVDAQRFVAAARPVADIGRLSDGAAIHEDFRALRPERDDERHAQRFPRRRSTVRYLGRFG